MRNPSKHIPALALTIAMAALAASPVTAARLGDGSSQPIDSAPVVPIQPSGDAALQAQQMIAEAGTPFVGEGAEGLAVARAQVLLDRHWFSPGEIDGRYGRNTRHAILNFQRSRGIPATGTVDGWTWQALLEGQQPAFTTYALTQQDLDGPYEETPHDPHEMATMDRLYYESPTEALSERFHASPEFLATLNDGRPLQAGQMLVVPSVGDAVALPQGEKHIVISKSQRMLYLVGEGEQLLAAFPISIGGAGVEIPVGQEMTINSDVKNPDFRYDADLLKGYDDPEPTVVPPGPNSPVGLVWMGLSHPHWGIHGTSEPSQMARVQTNGCIRLTNWDALRLSREVGIGTQVRMAA